MTDTAAPIDAASLDAALSLYRADLGRAAAETLNRAGIAPGAVDDVMGDARAYGT